MFPFIRLFGPFRHYAVGFVFLALVGYQLSSTINPPIEPVQTNDPRLADVVAYENLLQQKAEAALNKFGASSHTVDLSVSLDHITTTTTTFDPTNTDESNGTVAGTWQEETTTSPKINRIMVCVTLDSDRIEDQDQLFRSLSYTLGIDLSRGDLLRLVFK